MEKQATTAAGGVFADCRGVGGLLAWAFEQVDVVWGTLCAAWLMLGYHEPF
ncbi:hypothetical protein ACFPVT_08785 [Corynebacterium choanae]|uniref:hypothetical protein n=1 Tax=Corynebacterium choanae TaxID=1862358 RepID=UPI0013DE738E|nr:hypothetical protein [Corynebacterium choanae]